VVWTFILGMICGAALLIVLTVVSDKSFLDLLTGRFQREAPSEPDASFHELQRQKRLAVGGDS
jgi:hypothetical protein